MLESAYDMLRIGRDASPEMVRKAYVTLVRRYPPEHFPEKFASIRQAYQRLTLDDNFIEEMLHRTIKDGTPLKLAGCLWGDRKELKPEKDLDLTSLAYLLIGEDMRRDLDGILSEAAQNIEWKTE